MREEAEAVRRDAEERPRMGGGNEAEMARISVSQTEYSEAALLTVL
jgi:hypothetical protein